MTPSSPDASLSQELAGFVCRLEGRDLPSAAVQQTKALFLDWTGSCLAGRSARPVTALCEFAATMGPDQGPSQLLPTRAFSSPWFAALVNAASSHVVEQDDLHNSSVFHPATVVFPAALATAQALRCSGDEFITACVAGYEVGVRVGEYLGRSHYKIFHTTATAGTLAAAAAVGRLLRLDEATLAHALGSAGTQAAGLWEFLRDGADSKQLHTAKAAADGLLSAYTASSGLTGARRILEGDQGMAAGMLGEGNAGRVVDGLGSRWTVAETSFKFHASCRHTHPAADALLELVTERDLQPADISRIRAHVYKAAIDVLGPVTAPQTIHQSKFCMGFVLALIARERRAGIDDFSEAALRDPELRRLCQSVEMHFDPEIDERYPDTWSARVEVDTRDGECYECTVRTPKGDPDNPLTAMELEDKVLRLATYAKAANESEAHTLIELAYHLEEIDDMAGYVLP